MSEKEIKQLNIILKTYARLDQKTLLLLIALVKEMIEYDKEHGHMAAIVLPLILEKWKHEIESVYDRSF